jgi:hypothetical protein
MTPPRLIAGPYLPPRGVSYRPGRTIQDLIRGEVVIGGISDAPIPWPTARRNNGRPVPIVMGGLVAAISTESAEAICYHWGVSRWTVNRWRRALGIPRFNPGTKQLWIDLAKKLHTPDARKRHHEAVRDWAARMRDAKEVTHG